ncbi:MAG: aldehyde ferredoxin oxidoreductase family protein, partial [Candidatus Bipolaricaulota bacterium]
CPEAPNPSPREGGAVADGICGKVLYVDLSSGSLREESPDERFYRAYLGGWGLIAHELMTSPRGIDPFAPENPLIFATGVATGTPIPGSGRHAVGAKSPLTGAFGEADVGGYWGAELKRAGFDAVVITGAAEAPTYLWIADGIAELRDAQHLWGKTTAEVERQIRDDAGDDKVRVAQCGVAGENLVRFACVMHDVNRAAGRTGLGAVMGSKKLRAVAVRGSASVAVADDEKARRMREFVADRKERWAGFQEHGTGGGIARINAIGRLPTHNFRDGNFAGAEKIDGRTMTESLLVDRDTCFACPIRCKRVVQADGEYTVDSTYGGPEYESLASLGSICGVDHLEAVCYANQLCNAYGLDTISTGVTIGWAMECFERGLLTTEDTAGVELRFGDHEAMTSMVEAIARREGFGDTLAEGSLRAARAVGRDTERFAVQAKGQEFPMHDPRYQYGLGIGYATSPTGADHMHNFHDSGLESDAGTARLQAYGFQVDPMPRDTLPAEKAAIAASVIRARVMSNCIGLCAFQPFGLDELVEVVQAVTGWPMNALELLRVGERGLALARLYNAREGLTAADDTHHTRFTEPLQVEGQDAGSIPAADMAEAIEVYYEIQGWDPTTGAPTRAKLIELGLGWASGILEG